MSVTTLCYKHSWVSKWTKGWKNVVWIFKVKKTVCVKLSTWCPADTAVDWSVRLGELLWELHRQVCLSERGNAAGQPFKVKHRCYTFLQQSLNKSQIKKYIFSTFTYHYFKSQYVYCERFSFKPIPFPLLSWRRAVLISGQYISNLTKLQLYSPLSIDLTLAQAVSGPQVWPLLHLGRKDADRST